MSYDVSVIYSMSSELYRIPRAVSKQKRVYIFNNSFFLFCFVSYLKKKKNLSEKLL